MKTTASIVFALLGSMLGLVFVLTGCSRDPQSGDNPPADLRGEPINPPRPATATVAANTPPAAPALARTTASTTPAVPAAKPVDRGFSQVTFEKLASFDFVIPDETVTTNGIVTAASKADEQIPQTVKSLHQTSVALKGFMLPLKVEGGLVTEMLLMRDQSMCCYGKVPKMNEWVSIKMGQKGVKAVMDQPVTVYGKIHVGEIRENGYLVGIYRLDGEKMADPE